VTAAGPASGPRLPVLERLARLPRWLRAAGFLGSVALVAVIAVRAARDLDRDALVWWPLPLAVAAAAAWWLLLAVGWSVLAAGRVERAAVATWCRTQALRYLPGGIWAPASRVVVVGGSVLDRLSTVAAENVVALCAAVALGGVALAAAGDIRWAPAVLAVAAPVLAARFVSTRTRIDRRRVVRATGVFLGGFLAYMLAAVLAQTAVSGWENPLEVAGAAAVAWGAGLVVVIAPGGLGVRELVYVALLAGTVPSAEAGAAAVTLRLVTVAAELAVLLAAGRHAVGQVPGERVVRDG
jgi:hypothetical protein